MCNLTLFYLFSHYLIPFFTPFLNPFSFFLSLLERVSLDQMLPTATTAIITPTTETTTSSQCSQCNGSAIIGSPDKRKKQLGPYLLLDTLSLSDEYSKTKRAVHVHTGKEV